MNIGHIAKRVETALAAGSDLKAAVDEAYDELRTMGVTDTAHVGVSGDHVVVFLPGYTPLSNPEDFVKLSKRVT